MKKSIHKKSDDELLKDYPIKGKTEGWYFRAEETSNNAWEVVGSDAWGRKVCVHGNDRDALIEEAEMEAQELRSKLDDI